MPPDTPPLVGMYVFCTLLSSCYHTQLKILYETPMSLVFHPVVVTNFVLSHIIHLAIIGSYTYIVTCIHKCAKNRKLRYF